MRGRRGGGREVGEGVGGGRLGRGWREGETRISFLT